MAGVVVVVAIAVFLGGALIGAIGALVMGAHRKGWGHALAGVASSRLAIYTRRLNGQGSRDLHIPPGGPLPR